MTQRIALILAFAAMAAVAQIPQRGAKVAFYDPYSNQVQLAVGKGDPGKPSGTKPAPLPPSPPVKPVPVDIGLRYSVDLLQNDGSVTKVTSAREFHSGEKVRLHLQSNI